MRREVDLSAECFRHLVAVALNGRDLAAGSTSCASTSTLRAAARTILRTNAFRVSRGTLASAGMMPQ
jgi:hypothetical protein